MTKFGAKTLQDLAPNLTNFRAKTDTLVQVLDLWLLTQRAATVARGSVGRPSLPKSSWTTGKRSSVMRSRDSVLSALDRGLDRLDIFKVRLGHCAK